MPRILVIDDEPGIHESFRIILEGQYEVLGAFDGPTALKIMDSYHVDLVLLDLQLPDMGGLDVLARIKEATPQMKVIVVTGMTVLRTAIEVMKLGAFDYLTKPFGENELLSLIQRALTNYTDDPLVLSQPAQKHFPKPLAEEYVLFVGSELGLLITLKLALEHYCSVEVTANIADALWHLSRKPPALLVVHTSLPPADRTHLLRVLHSDFPYCPAIIVSSYFSKFLSEPEIPPLPIRAITADCQGFNDLLYEILALVSIRKSMASPLPTLGSHVAKAMCYIGTHFAEALTVKTLAINIGISEGHLAHLFPAELRVNIKEFVIKVRIEVAKHLLGDQRYTLEHIAELTGFCNASHLSRVFQRSVGCPPGDYRRALKGLSAQ